MAAEHNKATAARLSSLGRAESPECDRTSTVLGEPALELALGGVVRKTAKMQDLGALAQESTHVAARIERAGKDVWVARWVRLRGTRLLRQRPQAASQSESLLQSAARRGRCERLEMERQTTSDLARRADLLHLKTSADRRQARGAERQRLRVVRLESLVLAAQTKEHWVLEVRWEYHALVTSFARHLHTEVPRRQGDESKLGCSTRAGVLVHEVLGGVGIEGGDGIAEAAGVLNVLPSQGGKGGA